jgi:hypothetical protein
MQPPRVSVLVRGWDVRTGTTGQMALDAVRLAEDIGLDGLIVGDHVTFSGYGNDGLILLTAYAAVNLVAERRWFCNTAMGYSH